MRETERRIMGIVMPFGKKKTEVDTGKKIPNERRYSVWS